MSDIIFFHHSVFSLLSAIHHISSSPFLQIHSTVSHTSGKSGIQPLTITQFQLHNVFSQKLVSFFQKEKL